MTVAVDAELSTIIGVPRSPEASDEPRPSFLAWMADRERIPVVAWELSASCGVEPASSYVET